MREKQIKERLEKEKARLERDRLEKEKKEQDEIKKFEAEALKKKEAMAKMTNMHRKGSQLVKIPIYTLIYKSIDGKIFSKSAVIKNCKNENNIPSTTFCESRMCGLKSGPMSG